QLLEIESIIESFANAGILEFLAPQVGHEAQPDAGAGIVLREGLLDDAAFGNGGEIIGGGPAAGGIFGPPVELVTLEGLELHGQVEKILDAIFVKIVLADLGGLTLAPIILDPLVGDAAAGVEAGQFIGA